MCLEFPFTIIGYYNCYFQLAYIVADVDVVAVEMKLQYYFLVDHL